MPSPFTILLDVKPHIKNYLLTLYGPTEPITFPKKSDYNNMLVRLLNPPPGDEYTPNFSRLEKIEIYLPHTNRKCLESSNYLSRDDAKKLRLEIDWDFYSDYRAFIRRKMNEGINRKEAIVLFMEVCNIQDEHLSFSAFYRDYNRQLKRRRLTFCKSEQ